MGRKGWWSKLITDTDLLKVQNFTPNDFRRKNLRQKVCKFCQYFNRDKLKNLIKYTWTVQFSIYDYTRQLCNKAAMGWLKTYFSLNFYQKKTRNLDQNINQLQNTTCLERKNLRKSRKFYASAATDAGHILKFCLPSHFSKKLRY